MAIKCYRRAIEAEDRPENWEEVDWDRAIRVIGNSYRDPQSIIMDAAKDGFVVRTPYSFW